MKVKKPTETILVYYHKTNYLIMSLTRREKPELEKKGYIRLEMLVSPTIIRLQKGELSFLEVRVNFERGKPFIGELVYTEEEMRNRRSTQSKPITEFVVPEYELEALIHIEKGDGCIEIFNESNERLLDRLAIFQKNDCSMFIDTIILDIQSGDSKVYDVDSNEDYYLLSELRTLMTVSA